MNRFTAVWALPLLCLLAGCTRDPKEVAKKYVETGNKYFDKGQLKEASIMYRRALQRNMRDPQAYYRLALVQERMGLLGEAHRSLLRATDLDSKNTEALAELGDLDATIYQRDPITYRSFLSDANDVAAKLLARNPKSYEGLRISAFVSAVNKDVPGAIAKVKQANEVNPDQPDLMLTLVKLLDANKQPDEAIQVAKRTIDKHRDYGPMYDYLYMKYASSGHIADAEEVLKQKVASNPKNGSDLVQLAFHYYLARRPADMDATIQKLTSDPKNFPDGPLLAGDLLMRVGQTNRAFEQYQHGEKSDLKNKTMYWKREARSLMREGKSADAEKIVARLMQQTPNDLEAVTMHATLLTESHDPKQIQKAIEEMQRVVTSTPSTDTASLQFIHFNMGRAYEAKGDANSLEQARLQFEEAIKVSNDKFPPAQLALADLLANHGESSRAIEEADKVLAKAPANLAAHLVRTRSLMSLGEVGKARQELTALAKANPNSKDIRYQLATLDLFERKYKDAEAGYAALMNANDPRGYRGMIESKVRQGDYETAIKMVHDRLSANPGDLELHRMMAELDLRAKRNNDAVAEYQLIVKKEPTEKNYTDLGAYQELAGEPDAAMETYKKARELQPNDVAPLIRMAIITENAGRKADARKMYEEVLKLQPDNPYALNNIAYAKADEGVDLDQALTYAERARQKLPNDPDVDDTVGLIYLRKNLVDDSLRVLSQLVNRVPQRSAYHLHYAAALLQKGDRTAAGKELDAATRSGPNEHEKTEIQELRRKLTT